MEVAGSSRPASGSEHLISHAYDQLAARPRCTARRSGVATIATTWLQDNPRRETVLQVLEETGFLAFIRADPLERDGLPGRDPAGAVRQARLSHRAVGARCDRAADPAHHRRPALGGSARLRMSILRRRSIEGAPCPCSPCTTATPTTGPTRSPPTDPRTGRSCASCSTGASFSRPARYPQGPAGALLVFRADSAEQVAELLRTDPFRQQDLVTDCQIRQWGLAMGPWTE